MARFEDFDAFLGESGISPATEATSFEIKLLGKKWHLPRRVPATAILRAQRFRAAALELAGMAEDMIDAAKDGTDADVQGLMAELSESDVARAKEALAFDFEVEAKIIATPENVEAWLERGLTYSALQAVYWRLIGKHESGELERAEGESKAGSGSSKKTTRARSPRSSSSRSGGSSKAT